MDGPVFNSAPYWRKRAEEARAIAAQLDDAAARQTMMDVAASYDRLAARVAEKEPPRAGWTGTS